MKGNDCNENRLEEERKKQKHFKSWSWKDEYMRDKEGKIKWHKRWVY